MKKNLLFIFAFIAVAMGHAQIPNPGFEDWTDMGGYNNPDGWSTLNSMTDAMSIYTCTKGTPGSPGAAYLKLTSKTVTGVGVVPGVAVCGTLNLTTFQPEGGFPFTQRPDSYDGKWQHMIFGNSQGSIVVTLTKWNSTTLQRDVIGVAQTTLTGMAMSWANFSIGFEYNSDEYPDTCSIYMNASGNSPTNSDYLWVDNLSFQGEVAGGVQEQNEARGFSIYPNPGKSDFNVAFRSSQPELLQVKLVDMKGAMISSQQIQTVTGRNLFSLDHLELSEGIYLVNIIGHQGMVTEKLIVQ